LRVFCHTRGYSNLQLFVEDDSGAKIPRPPLDAMIVEIQADKVVRGT